MHGVNVGMIFIEHGFHERHTSLTCCPAKNGASFTFDVVLIQGVLKLLQEGGEGRCRAVGDRQFRHDIGIRRLGLWISIAIACVSYTDTLTYHAVAVVDVQSCSQWTLR